MPPKNRIEQPLNQGQLFQVEISREHPAVIGDAIEGGVFPEDIPPTEESAEQRHFHEVVHERVVAERESRNRRQGQQGKHSPLEQDGSYNSIRLGDYLPGFGPVKERNFDEAQAFAADLEAKRLADSQSQPSLFTPSPEQVHEAISKAADALDIRRGLEFPGEAPKDPDVANTQIKLEALRDDSRADFLPTTHREKSSAYELLDYMEPGKYERGISTRLDEIFYRQQREAKKQEMTPEEGHEIAKDTVRSIIREWGDYYANAKESWIKLDALGKLVDGPNPMLTMETLLDDENTGEVVTQVVRFNALLQLRDTDKPLGFDPLWVREDRTKPTEEKHKTVEDMFTHKSEEFMAAYVRRRAQQMTVGQVRKSILMLKRDQANRGKFWRGALESLHEDYKEYADLALAPQS